MKKIWIWKDHLTREKVKVLVYRNLRKKHSPSVIPCVNPTQIPTPLEPPRPKSKSLPSFTSIVSDEMEDFIKADNISFFKDLCYKIM